MALNIKNAATVALVRELAAKTGQTQTSAIEQAVRAQLERIEGTDAAREERAASRRERADRLVEEIRANTTDKQRGELRTALEDMYDEDGLPTW